MAGEEGQKVQDRRLNFRCGGWHVNNYECKVIRFFIFFNWVSLIQTIITLAIQSYKEYV